MPPERSGSFSRQKANLASISGSMFGSCKGQYFLIVFRVLVLRPQRSLISKVGSSETVIAQPGARLLTYGWSIQVPAKSKRVGIWLSTFFKEVLERASRPFCGVLLRTMYSIPRSRQKSLLISLLPSSFTTRISGLSMSTVGTKSMRPLPALMKASFT